MTTYPSHPGSIALIELGHLSRPFVLVYSDAGGYRVVFHGEVDDAIYLYLITRIAAPIEPLRNEAGNGMQQASASALGF